MTHPLTVEGVLGSGLKAPFVTLSAADHMNDFAFDAEVKVFPAGRESREAELQGTSFIFSYIKCSYCINSCLF